MATEPAPAEINLREPRKRGRDFSALLWLGGWGVATAVALSALAITSQTQTATDRLRSIFAVSEPSAVAQMPPPVRPWRRLRPKPKPIPSSPHLFLCRPNAPRLRRRP
ncbi:MAG: hypothetical protein WCF15_14150, partial [Pseudolabrys sp.]